MAFCVISRAESPASSSNEAWLTEGSRNSWTRRKPRPEKTSSQETRGQALLEEVEQGDFAIGARSEVGGAAFGRRGVVTRAVPEQHRFAEAGACGDQGLVGVRL